MKFNFGAVKNPVMETFVAEDKQGGQVIFKLHPINTDLALLVSQLGNVGAVEFDRLRYRIATNRIAEWQDVYDEGGNPVEFTIENFGLFLDMPSSIPFISAVVDKTIKDVQMLSVMTNNKAGEEPGKKVKAQKAEASENS